MEGPRPLQLDELDALATMYGNLRFERLPGGVFFPHNPNLFNVFNLDNLLVLKDADRICSHVGLNRFGIASMGCTFAAGCIGGVHTQESCRSHGLATRLLLHTMDRARHEGVDFLIISGRRGLYLRNHAVLAGVSYRYQLSAAQTAALSQAGIEVCEAEVGHLQDMAGIHALEPVRTVRPRRVWEFYFQTHSCHFSASKPFLVSMRGVPVAYLIVKQQLMQGLMQVWEFAGDRTALCAALAPVMQRQQAEKMALTAMSWDRSLAAHLLAHRAGANAEPVDGTVVVINFAQTLERFRPHLAETLGTDTAARLHAECTGDVVSFRLQHDTLTLDVDAATRLLFGTPPGATPAQLGDSSLGIALRQGLPIPLPACGMDYV